MDGTLDLARTWLNQCREQHVSCRRPAELITVFSTDNAHIVRSTAADDQLPRRLLYFGSDLRDNIVRLLEIGKTTEHIEYFTLSHRWGINETFKTIEATLEDFKDGIDFSCFPKTYADAICITRTLGYQYLWIDSLCIKQDDEEDWKYEGSRMSLIYGNSVCNIMARDAPDADSGIFRIDDEVAAKERWLHGSDLLSRGWVLQERMMPPRILSYHRNEVSWECRECTASEHLPTLRTIVSGGRETLQQLFGRLSRFRINGVEAPDPGAQFVDFNYGLHGELAEYLPFLRAWWQFIELYTPCGLTFEKDRLVAINGIASTVHSHLRLRSTWGLWNQELLVQELTWSIDTAGPSSRRTRRWRAPTWSWASTTGGRVVNELYRRLPAEPRLMMKPEVHGPVSTSFDQTLPMTWPASQYKIGMHGDLRSGDLNVSQGRTGELECSIVLESKGRWSDAERHNLRLDAPLPVGSHDVRCFLVFHYDKGSLVDGECCDVRLVLVSVGDLDDGDGRVMKRIGYLESCYEELRDMDGINEDLWWREIQLGSVAEQLGHHG